jgi:hypothetical protein
MLNSQPKSEDNLPFKQIEGQAGDLHSLKQGTQNDRNPHDGITNTSTTERKPGRPPMNFRG